MRQHHDMMYGPSPRNEAPGGIVSTANLKELHRRNLKAQLEDLAAPITKRFSKSMPVRDDAIFVDSMEGADIDISTVDGSLLFAIVAYRTGKKK